MRGETFEKEFSQSKHQGKEKTSEGKIPEKTCSLRKISIFKKPKSIKIKKKLSI